VPLGAGDIGDASASLTKIFIVQNWLDFLIKFEKIMAKLVQMWAKFD